MSIEKFIILEKGWELDTYKKEVCWLSSDFVYWVSTTSCNVLGLLRNSVIHS